ncbi:hypothetical protein BCR34DRAFT_604768 [Clohesyomyces aquaticus]|uniref:Transglycosylase SLT domain-containing protein n=1 Tax=Clohesyomyces aquaticus TaxID=1231657 RepID=A0A1Y1Z300_9PLEO|nr:hypothetical protein BCR34DRAFT_604768 [Clohesyomyces aquaticus]
MYSLPHLLLLVPFCLALPNPLVRRTASYGDKSLVLSDDFVKLWYDDYDVGGNQTRPIGDIARLNNSTGPWSNSTGSAGNSTGSAGNSTWLPKNPESIYSCAGPDVKDYPTKESWLSFNTLWAINSPIIDKSNNNASYTKAIKTSIQNVSKASKVDARLILALIMQESAGKAKVACTGYDYKRDCGLMQMRGAANFSSSDPEGSIQKMIEDSVYGVGEPGINNPNGTPGFFQLLQGRQEDLSWINGTFWQGNPFAAAHLYNAGAVEQNLTVQVGENLNNCAMTTFQLPPTRNILITTPNTILLHSEFHRRKLFRCATPDGILNARAAKDNSGLVAIADSHLVILYDVKRGKDRQYRLKSGDGEPRLLLFSPCSQTLYFTTTLSPSIQAYSIPNAELLPPLQTHPSPPNVLAISKPGAMLLSASPKPPTVFIQDLRMRGNAPISFHPNRSQSSIVCASFHDNDLPPRKGYCVFVLGFQDGTLALYRLMIPEGLRWPNAGDPNLPSRAFQLHQPSKLGFFKRLHKAAMGGISAAEFIPGYKSRVVSVGHDGRCRLVDFEDGGSILRTWYVSGPATCLSVIPLAPIETKGRKDKTVVFSGDAADDTEPLYEGTETLITVGTEAGKVMVFNILGLLIHEIPVEASVVSVEWVGDMSAASALPFRQPSMSAHPSTGASLLPQPHPALDVLVNHRENVSEETIEEGEESGTVRVTPQARSNVGSPIPLMQTRDFFSPPSEGQPRPFPVPGSLAWTPRKVSAVSYGSPEPIDRTVKRSRNLYPRPRIVTETFTSPPSTEFSPNLSLSASGSNRPSPNMPNTSNPTTPCSVPTSLYASQQVLQTPRNFEPALMSGALPFRFDSDDSLDTENRLDGVEESEIWMTPSTSHHTQSSRGVMSPKASVLKDQPKVRFQFSSPLKSDSNPPSPVAHQSRFPRRSSPKVLDGESPRRRERWLHRSPGISTPEQEGRRMRRPTHHGLRRVIDSANLEETVPVNKERRTERLEKDNEVLRKEMEALRRDFAMLKEALLASRA